MKLTYTFFASQNRLKSSIAGYAAMLLLSSFLSFSQAPVFTYPNNSFDVSKAVHTGKAANIAAELSGAVGLAFNGNGTKMFVLEGSVTAGYAVVEYTLSTDFDVTTASYAGASEEFDLSGESERPTDIAFDANGNKMFIVRDGAGGNIDIYEYDLSSNFNVSTANYAGDSQRFVMSSTEGTPQAMAFNDTGSKIYTLGSDSDIVEQFVLTSNYDISTAIDPGLSDFNVGAQESLPTALAFSEDGLQMFVSGSEAIQQYSLSTAFDPSTASYAHSFSIAAEVAQYTVGTSGRYQQSLAFAPDGTKMFVTGGNAVIEYHIGEHIMLNENNASVGINVDANDGSGGATDTSVTYSLAGDDAALFTIYSSGKVFFNTPPDYENPLDANTDNKYEISVIATGGILSSLQRFVVEVLNIPDTPIFTNATLSGNPYQVRLTEHAGEQKELFVGAEEDDPRTFTFSADGTKVYVLGQGQGRVIEYNLSTAFDLNSASYSAMSSLLVFGNGSTYQGMAFNNTGTQLSVVYEYFTANDYIRTFSLSTAWDISTLNTTSAPVVDINATEPSPREIAYSVYGTKMYIVGTGSSGILTYDLTSPFNPSTGTHVATAPTIDPSNSIAMAFNTSGTQVFELRKNLLNTKIRYYDLSAPFDLTTHSNLLSGFILGLDPIDMAFNDNGTKLFLMSTDKKIITFNLAVPIEVVSGSTDVINVDANDGMGGATDSSVTYTVSGIDAGAFSIDASGNLSFSTAPDFNNPTDANGNNLYEVSVVAANNYGTETQKYLVEVVSTLSAAQEADNLSIKVYPNPASSTLFLESQTPITSVTLYDVVGKQVAERKNLQHTNHTLDISALTQGLYFVTIETQKQKHSQKVIIN